MLRICLPLSRLGKTCTKLDLSQKYQQLLLNGQSKKYVVVKKGLFCCTIVSSTPGVFQHVIQSVPQGILKAVVYLDDILITGETDEEHLQILDKVLEWLEAAELKNYTQLSRPQKWLGWRASVRQWCECPIIRACDCYTKGCYTPATPPGSAWASWYPEESSPSWNVFNWIQDTGLLIVYLWMVELVHCVLLHCVLVHTFWGLLSCL